MRPNGILSQHFCIPIAGTQFSGIPIAGTQFSGIPITWTQTQQSFGIPITGTCLTNSKFLSPGLNPPASITGTLNSLALQSMRPNGILSQHFCIPIAGTQFSGIPIAVTQFSGIPITWTQTQQSFGIFLSPGLNPPASQSLGHLIN
ncbi:hypothetical protein niasHT_028150 [Heterodera trifolii]|uniref:Uncharacterized protein n=1 Tax=Heterodera trifolii TaxID=157864 RepID=A0ABD2JNY6_9BILA